jgi:hypothetical protein
MKKYYILPASYLKTEEKPSELEGTTQGTEESVWNLSRPAFLRNYITSQSPHRTNHDECFLEQTLQKCL